MARLMIVFLLGIVACDSDPTEGSVDSPVNGEEVDVAIGLDNGPEPTYVCPAGTERVIITGLWPMSWIKNAGQDYVLRVVGYGDRNLAVVDGLAFPQKAYNRYCFHGHSPFDFKIGDTACLESPESFGLDNQGQDCHSMFSLIQPIPSTKTRIMQCIYKLPSYDGSNWLPKESIGASIGVVYEYKWFHSDLWEMEVPVDSVNATGFVEGNEWSYSTYTFEWSVPASLTYLTCGPVENCQVNWAFFHVRFDEHHSMQRFASECNFR